MGRQQQAIVSSAVKHQVSKKDESCFCLHLLQSCHLLWTEVWEGAKEHQPAQCVWSASPRAWGFPGLRPGDRWCLCSRRWRQAMYAGKAPLVALEASHRNSLRVNSVEEMSTP